MKYNICCQERCSMFERLYSYSINTSIILNPEFKIDIFSTALLISSAEIAKEDDEEDDEAPLFLSRTVVSISFMVIIPPLDDRVSTQI